MSSYTGMLRETFRQNSHLLLRLSSSTALKPLSPFTHSWWSWMLGTPGTSGAVSFKAFGSPVIKNEPMAPIRKGSASYS